MGKKCAITAERLAKACELAAERLREKTAAQLRIDAEAVKLKCVYKGLTQEDAPLNALAKVTFHWSLPEGMVEHKTTVSHVLYRGPEGFTIVPWELKVPLLASCIPAAITQHQIPSMLKYKGCDVKVRSLALAKHYAGNYQTTLLVKQSQNVEHLLCAHVKDDTWLVHDGKDLSPQNLFKQEVPHQNQPPTKKRLKGKVLLEPISPCESLSSLMALAHFQAEMLRAESEGRDPDLDNAEASPPTHHHRNLLCNN